MNKIDGIFPNDEQRQENGIIYFLMICDLSKLTALKMQTFLYGKNLKTKEITYNNATATDLKSKQYELITDGWECYDWYENNNIQSFFYKKLK